MYLKYSITAVLPCYNEEKGVEKVLSNMPSFLDEIIVVDNNSTDSTAKVAKKWGAKVVRERIQGYGAALRSGLNNASSELIVTLDGDGTYSPKSIKPLVKYLHEKKVDFVSANRFNHKHNFSMPILNHIGNVVLTNITQFLFHKKIKDSQSGMFLLKRDLLPLLKTSSDGMSFSEEIKILAIFNRKIRFAEFPIEYQDNLRLGKKKLRLWQDGLENIIFLFKLWIKLNLTKSR